MSRRVVLCVWGVLETLFIIYLAYEAKLYGYDTMSVFFDTYIDTPQKYLFNGCLYGVPVIYGLSKPFLSPEYKVRYKKNIAYKILTKSIFDAFVIAVWVMALFTLSCVLMNIEIEPGWFLATIYIRLVILYAQCSGLFYLIYALATSQVIAVCSVVGINFFAMAAILLGCYIAEPLSDISINVYISYICISCVLAFVLLAYVVAYRSKNI